MEAELKQHWDAVWEIFDRLEKGKSIKRWELNKMGEHLQACELAQKDETIQAYVLLALKARTVRLAKLKAKGDLL